MKILFILAAIAVAAVAAEKPVAMKDLPAAVRKTVQDQTRGAEIKGLSKETENGKTTYEVETMVNGKHRDITVDAQGVLAEVEEETAITGIPAAARAAIEKKAAGGTVGLVETVTRGRALFYEASYTGKDEKKHQLTVKPDGTPAKD